jgi:hypothetical protein
MHSEVINPIVTVGGILALLFQRQKAYALSFSGLAAQAIVFALVALSWTARVRFYTLEQFPLSLHMLIAWYQMVGWVAVDNCIFAIVQCVLLCLARHQQRRFSSLTTSDQEPLLSHRTG